MDKWETEPTRTILEITDAAGEFMFNLFLLLRQNLYMPLRKSWLWSRIIRGRVSRQMLGTPTKLYRIFCPRCRALTGLSLTTDCNYLVRACPCGYRHVSCDQDDATMTGTIVKNVDVISLMVEARMKFSDGPLMIVDTVDEGMDFLISD